MGLRRSETHKCPGVHFVIIYETHDDNYYYYIYMGGWIVRKAGGHCGHVDT